MARATTPPPAATRQPIASALPTGSQRQPPLPAPKLSLSPASNGDEGSGTRPRRPGRRRGGGRQRPVEAEPAAVQPDSDGSSAEGAPEGGKPKRRRGSRGGRRHRRGTAETPAVTAEETPVAEAAQPRRRGRAPRPPEKPDQAARPPAENRPARAPTVKARARIPVTGAPTDQVPEPFAHNAEYEFARILDFYGIDWQYEPRSFPLRWDRGHMTEAFTPDFYLPDMNLYVELTTLKSSLTAEKNRKMRLMKELYPEVNIIMLKKRDYLRLLAKYGYGPLSPGQVPDIDRVLITATKIQQRVGQLGAQISRDYAGKEPVLVGVLRGVLCFISDLMRHISVPSAIDLMAISSYEGNGAGAVRILKDLDENIKGRDVILVEDIVDTGMTLNHVIDYLETKRPASVKVCTLLDKRARRIVNVPLDYVAFEIPDEFVVGYGLDFHQRFRNLPFIAVLKHELLP